MAKRTRRKKGPDGNLYTKEQWNKKFGPGSASSNSSTIDIKTQEQVQRNTNKKPVIEEKASKTEKNNAPTLIVSYVSSNGNRITKSFQCACIQMNEDKTTEMMLSGPKTKLHLSVEADVIEVL